MDISDRTDLTDQPGAPPEELDPEEVDADLSDEDEELIPAMEEEESGETPESAEPEADETPTVKRSLDGTEDRPRKRITSKQPDWSTAEKHALKAIRLSETDLEVENLKEKCVELAFPAMESLDQARRYLRDPAAYVISNVRKGRAEVTERRVLTNDDKEMVRPAKGREAQQFLNEEVAN